jgi:hypothetical protein
MIFAGVSRTRRIYCWAEDLPETRRVQRQHGDAPSRLLEQCAGAGGLSVSNRLGIADETLFENILRLWQHHGRQPRRRELASRPSEVSKADIFGGS